MTIPAIPESLFNVPSAERRSVDLTVEECDRVDAYLAAAARRIEAVDEHWIHGSDEGASYCLECANKKVAELLEIDPNGRYAADGGWGCEGDHTIFCAGCGKLLSNALTDFGCRQELDHFLTNGLHVESDEDCRAVSEVISASGWTHFVLSGESEADASERRDFYSDLHLLGRAILDNLESGESGVRGESTGLAVV